MSVTSPGATNQPRYLDWKTLDRVKRLDVRARLVVEGFITGQHRSPYNGFAVEFATHREYTPGDDLRHIDWKVWSKTDRLYIKEYEEETNLKCTLILDCSKSMKYGEGPSKFDYAATATASLAYLMQQQQDAVGLVTFNNRITKNLPASSHPNHLKLMLHELENTTPDETSDVAQVFPQLAQQVRRRGMVILVSDLFLDLATLNEALKQFRLRRHEVVVFHVMHDDELTFPFQDNTLFRGLETDVQLHTEPRALRKGYLEAVGNFLADVKKTCASSGVDYVLMNTKDPLDAVLGSYLTFRQRMRRSAIQRG
ncbi:protein of unknown function DUF58 [Pirellula staleyi DSM 6068]|uniref:DUF58 domain-containing protein n=1 Tax=Pirellula staleyi (strain ATCC 27377 / DSM 6068 / ICPB 4128) TaxID=530564 RepID=D2R6R8_PIRSD|nr:DUF58 domain-containing protein [Pirellula staleyi]ADB17368.1 protein of unknown function DUF58 [Pirellula staleyi DSM 6068]